VLFNLEKHLVVLATDTPNRRELLKRFVPEIHFKIKEDRTPFLPGNETAGEYLRNSVDRTISWCGNYLPRDYSNHFERMTIVAACSAVLKSDEILVKHQDDLDRTFRQLVGGSHRVLTALRVVSLAPDLHFYWERAETVETEVWIDSMNESEIKNYIVSDEGKSLHQDAAWFRPDSKFVTKIVGSESNVLGLPLCALGRMFRELENSSAV
jgi:predicted house-cleaning NTP pyrophosphatase (Maf/HAM1 superfamily)